jgi:hypothetical protein
MHVSQIVREYANRSAWLEENGDCESYEKREPELVDGFEIQDRSAMKMMMRTLYEKTCVITCVSSKK